MNFKKTIAKSLVVAMALGMVPVANLQTAKAEAATITFDGTKGIAKSDKAKFWGIAKEAKKKGKDTVNIKGKDYKITNIQEVIEKEIDVYAALKGKGGVIVAGEKEKPDADWGILTLAPAESTFKVYMVASKGAIKGIKGEKALGGEYGYLAASTGKTPTEYDLKENADKVEVKLNNGSWEAFNTVFGKTDEAVNKKLHMLGQNGSALTFRIKGTSTDWASKEVKVKALAQAKGPSVKIDVSKDTTSIKSGFEYQVVKAGSAATNSWKLSTEKKGLTLPALALGADEDKDVLVRTAATSKKLASRITKVRVNKPAAKLVVPASGFTGTGTAIGKNAVLETNLAYDIKKGASLKNIGTVDLEYTLVADGTAADKIKWSTLKASKDPVNKPTKATLKYSETSKANTWGDGKAKLFVRLAGTKQTKENIATQSGVSAGAIMKLSNVAQSFKFVKAGSVPSDTAKAEIDVTDASTKAAIKVATGTAVTFTIKAKVEKAVKTGVAPKLKVSKDSPKGVTIKADKIAADGTFEIKVNVSNKAFKEVPSGKLTADFTFEGIKSGLEITFAKKN